MYSVPLLHVFNKFTIYWIIRVWLDFNTCTFIFDFNDYNKKNLTLTCHNFGQLSLFFYLLLSEYCQQPVCENQLKKKNKHTKMNLKFHLKVVMFLFIIFTVVNLNIIYFIISHYSLYYFIIIHFYLNLHLYCGIIHVLLDQFFHWSSNTDKFKMK